MRRGWKVGCAAVCAAAVWGAGGVGTARAEAPEAATGAGARALELLSFLDLTGGLSAGWFYASHPGPDASDNEALVSNVLVTLGTSDKGALAGFEAGFGEVSTPSLLDAPEPNRDVRVEFASVALRPVPDGELVVGLLKPLAGYEDTYTYNNRNAVSGVVASQQPYNAYGARAQYTLAGVELAAGYYAERLESDEYQVDRDGDGQRLKEAGNAWEVSVGGEVAGLGYRAYHYHLEGLKCLTGAVLEYTLGNVTLGLNADYWRWHASMSGYYGSKHAVGVALYAAPGFGSFSVPVRLEYVRQGESRMYVDNPDTRALWSATVTPTYRLTEKAYVRVEASYVHGRDAFASDDGEPKSSRACLAGEVGYLF